MRFRPFNQRAFEKFERDHPPDPAVQAMTEALALLVSGLGVAFDVYPEAGAISFRDHNGKLWEMQIAPSDAPYLRSEHGPSTSKT